MNFKLLQIMFVVNYVFLKWQHIFYSSYQQRLAVIKNKIKAAEQGGQVFIIDKSSTIVALT